MEKTYIKMNDNKCLSLGNVFNLIKEISVGKSAMQREIFCVLFDVKDINSTTVNNYLIGIRAIGIEYKKIYVDMYNSYISDRNVFYNIVCSLINLLDEKIYDVNEFDYEFINNNYNLKRLCIKLMDICDKDSNVDEVFKSKVKEFVNKNEYYDVLVELLYYAVVKNNQPVYKQEINIQINKKELDDYLKVKLYEGVSFIKSLLLLAKKKNMYACAELGALEYDGLVDGNVNYDKSFYYYLIAADKNHPKACYMIANLIYNRKVKYDFDMMWKYLNKSIKLGSSAGVNLKGLCYLNGITRNKEVSTIKAIKYFKIASENGYTYAFNNLGSICERNGKLEDAFNYYKISADLGDSWALNRVGEYYRKKNDLDLAYVYYKLSNECPVSERCKWAKYNLDKYFKD